MKIKILSVGKINSDIENIFENYLKKINYFKKAEHIILKNDKFFEKKILEKTEKKYLVCLEATGKNFSSEEFANFLEKKEIEGESEIFFVVAPAEGFSDEFKKKANFLFSLSKLTFAHDLALLLLAENIFRAYTILNNHPYHK